MTSSYILCRCRSGLNDCFNQLWYVLSYAKKTGREILFEMPSYQATDLSTVFDFSKFPVRIHTQTKPILDEFFKTDKLYPISYKPFLNLSHGSPPEPVVLNKELDISKDTLIVHDTTGGGHSGSLVFRYLKFQPDFIKQFYERYSLPPVYDAIHVRNTDLYFDSATFDSHVTKFISQAAQKPVFILSDNASTVSTCIEKYGCQKTYTTFLEGVNLHSHGSANQTILIDALHDLLILIQARNLLVIPIVEKEGPQRLSGFSILAKDLHNQKTLVKELCKVQRAKPSKIY
jgi:hypothetical protein